MDEPYLQALFIGKPKSLVDERGKWRSSIYRDVASGPVELETRGLVGDKVTNTRYHGSPEAAVCGHLMDHYQFWNEQYGMDLYAGNVGENFTLANITEDEICLGDVYQVGTARVQISSPRIPCEVQARRIGRSDWVKLTIDEVRLGFYMRVLEAGTVQAGDAFALLERPNPGSSLIQFNRCWYHEFDPEIAEKFATLPGLTVAWQNKFAKKLRKVEKV